jgi:hypothetical protein
MFPAIERELAKNKFFKAWKENSVFEGLLGTPPILVKEFSEKWVEDFKKLVGDGPMTYRFLVNLADYVEKICCLDGYSHIKERLLRLDDQLHPTIVEMEFIWFLLLKTPPQKMHLEFTFKSSTGKNPELMVDSPFGPVYFEVTSVEDYRQMNEILQYFNSLTAFQLSLKVLYGINRGIKVSFSEYPTEKTLQCIYKDINEFANKGQFLFKKEEPEYTVEMTEGIDVAFNLPIGDMERKIKDKIEEKTAKLAKGDRNYIAIDVTPILADIDVQLAKIREYFQYSENKTVWGVLLQSKAWTFDGLNPNYKHKVMCQANSFIKGKEPFNTISALIPDSS